MPLKELLLVSVGKTVMGQKVEINTALQTHCVSAYTYTTEYIRRVNGLSLSSASMVACVMFHFSTILSLSSVRSQMSRAQDMASMISPEI